MSSLESELSLAVASSVGFEGALGGEGRADFPAVTGGEVPKP